MRYPALARMLAVFLAVLSLVTLIAGALGIGRANTDHQEQRRQDELLSSRIAQTEELNRSLDEQERAYQTAADALPERQEKHRSDSAKYRMSLATYTATRSGLQMGRSQLDEASAALEESLPLFEEGLRAFEEGEQAFQTVYQVYQTLRGTIDREAELYGFIVTRVPLSTELFPLFSPDEVRALYDLSRSGNEQLFSLLLDLQSELPEGQQTAADTLRRAIEGFNSAGSGLGTFSVEGLAYAAAQALYDEALELINREVAEGTPPDEARADADRLCMERFGLSFGELGQWLEDNAPEIVETNTGSSAVSTEMLDSLLGMLPDDSELIATALDLLEENDRELIEKEEAYLASPYDMSAAELLLDGVKGSIDLSERLLGLIEPTILSTKSQMDEARAQLAVAQSAMESGQKAIKDGYKELDKSEKELEKQLKDMQRERQRLEKDRSAIDEMEALVDSYEDMLDRRRSLRAQLLGDDEIDLRNQQGEDYLAAARAELRLREPAHRQEFRLRLGMCALMLLAAALGVLSALGAFEKPKLRRLWLPLGGTALLAAASEGIALYLGRGLLYSSLGLLIFALGLLPLAIPPKKKQDV